MIVYRLSNKIVRLYILMKNGYMAIPPLYHLLYYTLILYSVVVLLTVISFPTSFGEGTNLQQYL